MLPKNQRLLSTKDFSRVFGKGRPYHHKILIVKTIKNSRDLSRVGFVISTKVTKKAVERNKIKRRLRSIVGKMLDNVEPGYDIAVIVKKDAVGCRFVDLEQALRKVMTSAGIIRQDTAP